MTRRTSIEAQHPRLPTIPSTTPYWRTQPSPLDEYRSSETVPEIVDIAIIGSGFAGACVAYQLLSGTQASNSVALPSIAIFEARQACSGATGRNGGHTKIPPRSIAAFAKKYGAASALEFALYLKELHVEMKACAESVQVGEGSSLMEECEMLVTRSWDVFLDEEHADVMEKEWNEALKRMKEVAIAQGRERELEWLSEVQFMKGENVEKVTSIRGAKAAFSCPALSLWPYKFVLGLLQHVLNLGAKLYTLTPVTKMARINKFASSDDTGFTALHTPRGITLARKVIFSTNAYVSNLLSQYEKTIIPGRGTACHINRQPPGAEYQQLVNTYNIHNSASSVEYFVPRPDGSFILGGGQILYRHDKEKWYDMIDDSTLIEGVKEKWFDGYMGGHFRGWNRDGTDEDIDYVWTGIMGYTEDSFPHVGLVPGETDHFILAGFNGSGMSYIFLVARAIARMVREGVSFEETGLPAVFKTVPGRIKATE